MNNAGAWIGIVVLGFAGTLFYQSLFYEYSGKYGPGPGLFPLWLSGSLILLSIIYVVDSIRKEVIVFKDILPKGEGLGKVLFLLAAIILFLIIVPYTGYTIASIVMLSMLFFREYKWYSGLLMSVLITFTVFYVFKSFLDVPLPVNSFGF